MERLDLFTVAGAAKACAGSGTAGQVLVLHDLLGLHLGRLPRFVRDFSAGQAGIPAALRAYVAAVKDGSFPDDALHAW